VLDVFGVLALIDTYLIDTVWVQARMVATSQDFHARARSGRSPAKEFHLPGKEVRVRRVGDKVILEPREKAPFDIGAWRAELAASGADEFLPQGLMEDVPGSREDEKR
jgi:antitoxin VapB